MLKQETEERSLPVWHSATQRTAEPGARVSGASLNRIEAEEVLQIAARLRSEEQERISVSDLEALAAERGISPRFVRQALHAYGRPQSRLAPTPATLPRVRLTRRQWQVSAIVVSLYGLSVVALPAYLSVSIPFMNAYPLLVVAALGYYLRYKRAGVAVVIAVMIASFLGLIPTAGFGALPGTAFTALFSPFVLLTWAAAGVGGAVLRGWIVARQLPSEPTVLTVSDLDQ